MTSRTLGISIQRCYHANWASPRSMARAGRPCCAFPVSILFFLAQVPPPPTPIAPAPAILRDIGIDQKLDAQVPADLSFKDESGKTVRLGDYFGRRPIVLTLVYYQCPMLCTMVLNDVVRAMRGIGTMNLGEDFDIVTVSFDPSETPQLAAAKKEQYVAEYGRPNAAAGWHFLTGAPEAISRLTQTVGFRYAWDEHTRSFAHASGIIVLTPSGRVARYFFGIDYAPSDLKLSLAEAGRGKISPRLVDRVLLYCFHYDPRTGKYGLLISRVLQGLAGLTLLLVGGFIAMNFLRDRRKEAFAGSASAEARRADGSLDEGRARRGE